MAQLYLIPNWFFGYDIALELLFGIIALLVSYYSYKVYKLSGLREPKIFSISFFLISASYFAWSFLNVFLVEELNESTKIIYLPTITFLSVLTLYSHILLFMSGLVTLFYMTSKVKSLRVYSLILILSLFAILFSVEKGVFIYLISSLILVYIVIYYYEEYVKNKNRVTFLLFLSFGLLILANVAFITGQGNEISYFISHMLELFAFGFILIGLVSVIQHGKKKKQT